MPKIQTMITGVYSIHISLDGMAHLTYTDGSKESGKLTDETMVEVLAWNRYQSGKTKKEGDINTFNIISQVQSQRVKELAS